MEEYPITKAQTKKLHTVNEAFSIAFLIELILKLLGLGPRNYIKDPFN
jgi:hypothetical protein